MTREEAARVLTELADEYEKYELSKNGWLGTTYIPAHRMGVAALRDMLKRQEGCWHCHGIEAHEIEYVTELKNAYLEHIKAPEAIPYRHCANCGRELSGNAEQVKEGEDETKSVEVEG